MNETIEFTKGPLALTQNISVAVFDFDGTISTLRCGWENVMRPLMLECIAGGGEPSAALKEKVDRYIDESTGIQTVYQMEWLAAEVAAAGGPQRDKWWYKEEYNRRLTAYIAAKKNALAAGAAPPESCRIAGAAQFLRALKNAGVELYLASGTDHADVCEEARLVGVYDLFTEVRGAPAHAAACSKEAVLRLLFEEKGLAGGNVLVVGDGKVEIALGHAHGAYTLGAATNEAARRGVNPVKRRRLIAAGADAIVGDFTCTEALTALFCPESAAASRK